MIGGTIVGVIIDYSLYKKIYENPLPLNSAIGNKCVVKHALEVSNFECKENQEYTGYFECEELVDHEQNSIDAEIHY